ncbi:MAG: M56 family metallopeptidase [Bacillota bacterium]|nr:M56 family metallopeptidase [Bacillota bacterium]
MIAVSLFKWIVCSSVMATLLICLALLVKFIFDKKLRASWHYMIWILVILKLLIPFGPESKLSIYNLFNLTDQKITTESYNVINTINTATSSIAKSTPLPGQEQPQGNTSSLPVSKSGDIIYLSVFGLIIWLFGAIIAITYFLCHNIQLINRLKMNEIKNTDAISQYFEDCKRKLGIRRKIRLKSVTFLNSPALFGIINPILLIPDEMFNKDSLWILKYSIYHELSHYKRKDITINLILSILLVVHWFNPIIWYAFYKLRQDSEIACDELALSYLGANENKNYGLALINMAERFSQSYPTALASCFFNDKTTLKRRLTKIATYNKINHKTSLMVKFIFAVLCLIVLTNAVENII